MKAPARELVTRSSFQGLDRYSSVLVLPAGFGAQRAEQFSGQWWCSSGRFVRMVIRVHWLLGSLFCINTFSGILIWMCRGEMRGDGHGATLETVKPHAIYDFLHGCPPIFQCSPNSVRKTSPILVMNTSSSSRCPCEWCWLFSNSKSYSIGYMFCKL